MPTVDPEALAKEFGYQSGSPYDATDNATSLAKEFGYDPNYKEPVQPEQSFWQGLQNDPTWLGTAKRLGIGALRGAKDVLDTGAEGLAKGASYVADKVLPEDIAAKVKQSADATIAEDQAARNQFNKEYPPSEGLLPTATEIGRVGGQIAATLPIMPTKAFGAINSAAGALPTVTAAGQKIAAPLLNRLTAAAGTGALGGAVLGGATSSTNDKSLAENVGEGALSGVIGGPLVEGAASLGKGIGGKIVGKISPTRADMAERAAQLGIDLKASQVSDSPTFKKYDQISGMLPFSGAQGITNNQVGQFTRAVSRTFGKDVEEITPQVIQQARKDIGSGMERIYTNSTVKADPQLQNDLTNIIRDSAANLSDAEIKPIFNNIRNIAAKVDPNTNTIPGDAFNALVKYDGILSKLQKNSNPNIKNAANDIRSALEDALTRSVSPADRAELGNLRGQYKAAMTIKDMVENDPEGKVNPLKLMRKVAQSPGGKLRSGELGELADIGREFFINPADSGTPLGTYILNNVAPAIHNPITAGAAAGGALMQGAGWMDLASGGFGLGLNRLTREAVNSKTIRQGLINAGKGSTSGKINDIARAIEPYSSELVTNRNKKPTRIEVTVPMRLPIALEKNK